ncbi:MAG TPA: hypothetical protein VHL59_13080, partial [Thermoanaerobaculia bacterium]|nr:hypothetical protein [Thermoanaerobaculia bacterium]
RRGDTFLLTYSGHGLAGTTPAGFQQSWCLYDDTLLRFGEDGLDALLARFEPGVRLLLVANCCYAASRGERTPATPRIRAHLVRITASTGRDVTFDRPDGKGPSPFVARFLDALASHEDGGFAGFHQRLSSPPSAMMSPQMEIQEPHDRDFLRLGPFRLASAD